MAKIVTPRLFNFLAGIAEETPVFDFPSVRMKITFLALDLAPLAALKMRLLLTNSSAAPVAVCPPVYLHERERNLNSWLKEKRKNAFILA